MTRSTIARAGLGRQPRHVRPSATSARAPAPNPTTAQTAMRPAYGAPCSATSSASNRSMPRSIPVAYSIAVADAIASTIAARIPARWWRLPSDADRDRGAEQQEEQRRVRLHGQRARQEGAQRLKARRPPQQHEHGQRDRCKGANERGHTGRRHVMPSPRGRPRATSVSRSGAQSPYRRLHPHGTVAPRKRFAARARTISTGIS